MSIARRGRVVRKSIRDTLAENNLWDRYYAAMAGLPPRNQTEIKAKRVVKPRDPNAEYESDIQIAIIAMARKHPRVRLVERNNSGTAVEQGEDGEKRYVRYNTVFKVGKVKMRKVDISLTIDDGRIFVIEVKRPPWTKPTDVREEEQQNYVEHVKAAGGYGMFATSVLEVEQALDAIKTI